MERLPLALLLVAVVVLSSGFANARAAATRYGHDPAATATTAPANVASAAAGIGRRAIGSARASGGLGRFSLAAKDASALPPDGSSMSTDEALTRGEAFLGDGYSEPEAGSGRYVSADGNRVFRMGDSDITGAHGGGPHVNFETLEPNPARPGRLMVGQNSHVYLTDP